MSMRQQDQCFGMTEHGQRVSLDFVAAMHTVVSGATRSGKSVTTYSILGAAAEDPRVRVAGIDPSGILLAPHDAQDGWIHLQTGDAEAAVAVVERTVRVMDNRNRMLMDRGHDKIPEAAFSSKLPVIDFVLEEYAGTLDWLKTVDISRKPAEKLHPRMVAGVGRLLREGAKAGIRVFTIIQRPEAAVLHDRAQYSRRISHRLDNADGVRMLFEAATPEMTAQLMNAQPGVGLIHEAGSAPAFYRADFIEYSDYRARVLAARS